MSFRDRLYRLSLAASRPAVAWSVAIVLGLMNTWPNRFAMNPDGITYLNLATQYLNGDWASSVNAYWSPLYPFLLATTLRLIPNSIQSESTIVHFLTFVLYLGAFGAFRYFLSALRESQKRTERRQTSLERLSLQSVTELLCAYSLFFWCALALVGFAIVTPDMTVALLIFIAAGLTLKLKASNRTIGYSVLGIIIGVSYLAKAVMFPLGIVMCICCGLPSSLRLAAKRSLLAGAGFFLIATPQVIAMSLLAGHFSYGVSGAVAYANEVNHVPKFWTGDPHGSGTPENGVRIVAREPMTFDLTYLPTTFSNPASDQLGYWMQGVHPHIDLGQQFNATKKIIGEYVDWFEVLLFASLVLYLLRRQITLDYMSLIIPGLAAFALYALVYAESRYLGAWIVILFLCFAASIQFDERSRRGVLATIGAIGLFYGVTSLNLTRSEISNSLRRARSRHPNPQLETALALGKLGVSRGSRVGGIGLLYDSYWARLAGVQISWHVPDTTAYSRSSPAARAAVLESFRRAGGSAVVSTNKPTAVANENWQSLGPAGYWVLLLR